MLTMTDHNKPRLGNPSNEDIDPGFSREEAEDWLNDVPLFEEEPRPKGETE